MAKVSVKLIGADETARRLSLIDIQGRAKFKELIQEHTLAIQKGARQRCPVNKLKGLGGRLRGSINPKFFNNGFTGEVGSNVDYAPFVEFGTGRRGAASPHPPLPSGYIHGPRAGMPAQPFLFPAFEEQRPKFLAAIAEVPGAL